MSPFLFCFCSEWLGFGSGPTNRTTSGLHHRIECREAFWWRLDGTLRWYSEQFTERNGSSRAHRFVWFDVDVDFAGWLLRLNVSVWAITFCGVLPRAAASRQHHPIFLNPLSSCVLRNPCPHGLIHVGMDPGQLWLRERPVSTTTNKCADWSGHTVTPRWWILKPSRA